MKYLYYPYKKRDYCVFLHPDCLYPSYFKLQVCWLRSFTRITYLSKLIGIHSLAAFLQLELFGVYAFFLFIPAINQSIKALIVRLAYKNGEYLFYL